MQTDRWKTPSRRASPSSREYQSRSQPRSPAGSYSTLHSARRKTPSLQMPSKYDESSIQISARKMSSEVHAATPLGSKAQFADLSSIQRVLALGFTDIYGVIPEEELAPFAKCPVHLENYGLFCIEDKNLYCIRCLYEQNEGVLSSRRLPKMQRLENSMDYLTRENESFIRSEAGRYLAGFEKSLREFQRFSVTFAERMQSYQELITEEFKEIRELLDQRETELLEMVKGFYTKKINENVEQVQYLTLFRDAVQKIKHLHLLSPTKDFALYQYNFTKKLKACINSLGMLDGHPKEEKPSILVDFANKKRLKKEISMFGKAINRGLFEKYFGSENQAQPLIPKKGKSSTSLKPSQDPSTNRRPSSSLNRNDDRMVYCTPMKSISDAHSAQKTQSYCNNEEISNQISFSDSLFEEIDLFAESSILTSLSQVSEMIEHLPMKFTSAKLLYSLRENGNSSERFHELCDGKGPCLVVAETAKKFVFGFYNPVGFSSDEQYCGSDSAWIFSLANSFEKTLVFKIKPEKTFIAVYNSRNSLVLGSTIEGKEDLYIDLDNPGASRSNVGYAYKLPVNIRDGKSVLCGKGNKLEIVELEVFQVTPWKQ